MSDELVRVSDSDRERAVATLREHLVQGRPSLEEFTQRMSAAYSATTCAPLVRVNAFVVFGGATVKVKASG
jgi:Domain of unknown function (DUF1707)